MIFVKSYLELVHMLRSVTQFLKDTAEFALALVLGLWSSDELKHLIGTAYTDQSLGLIGTRHELLDDLLTDKTLTTIPLLRRTVKQIEHLDLVWVLLSIVVKLVTQQDVFFGLISKDKSDLGLITSFTLLENPADDLKHRGNTSTTCKKPLVNPMLPSNHLHML
jgi:hypothetical protein